MLSLREEVLRRFETITSPIVLVSDPDSLLAEEQIAEILSEHEYKQVIYDDPIALRFAYESAYRQTSGGKVLEGVMVVVLREPKHNLWNLPYDILQVGTQLSFSMAELFPKLSYPVIKELEHTQLDKLYNVYINYQGEQLSDTATKELVIKNIYDIAPEMIRTRADLIKVLTLKHLKSAAMPKIIDNYLIDSLRRNPEFADWPLETIVSQRAEFVLFLQKSWEIYIKTVANKSGGITQNIIPFDQSDIRVYINNLFLEGWLKPVQCLESESLPDWAMVGILTDPISQRQQQIEKLINRVQREIPNIQSSYKDWHQLAISWAELSVVRHEQDVILTPNVYSRIEELQEIIEDRFESWLVDKYASIATLSYWPKPVMLHHIAPYLAHRRRSLGEKKIALIVIDGLALDQWFVLRHDISRFNHNLCFDETCVFAWVPTLTSVSRQTIFAAQIPLYFGDSFVTTENEGRRWRKFWENEGLQYQSIGYYRGLGSKPVSEIEAVITNPTTYILGLVVDTVDKVMHGMKLGSTGMHQQVGLWGQRGYLYELIDRLWNASFSVYLTSDHGNIEATGQGRPREGCLVEQGGQRARIYEEVSLLKQVQIEFPETIHWTGQGLPEGYHVLLSKGTTAFVGKDEQIISHGGITLEEVVVPFVGLKEERK